MGLVTYDLRDRVAWIGLDRPDKRNAVSDALFAALAAAIARAQAEARAIVLHGHGPAFCAGLDLAEHRARDPAAVFHHSRGWHRGLTALRSGPIPAVAALHGAVIGGGLEIASACHLRVADASAFFALPEAARGIYVGGGASVHLARLIGAARMADMMLTGRVLSAEEAERAGLVTYLVPEGAAADKAGALAARIASLPELSVLGILHALPRIQDMAEADGLFVESLTAALAQSGAAAAEGVERFLAGRAERLTGKDPSP